MSAPLFPIKKTQPAEEEKQPSETPNWLTIGQSFAPPKPATRMKAEDFFEISDEEEIVAPEKPEKKKKHRHKHKRREKSARKLQKMLVEVAAQQNPSGKSEEEITSELLESNIGEQLKDLELKRQFDKAQNLKPIILEKDLPPIVYDTVRREDQYKYGGFLIQEVPRYFRGVRNKILGLDDPEETKRIMKELNEMIGIYAKVEEEPYLSKLRYFSRRASTLLLREQLEEKPMRRAVPMPGFIPFMVKEEKKEEPVQKELVGFEFDPSQATEEDRNYLQKTKEFNEKLRRDPKNLNTWLEYIELQDVLVQTKYEKQKMERKIAIIEKALKSVEPFQRIELILLFMKAMKAVGTLQGKFEEQNAMWKNYLEQYPLSYTLLMGYIHFLLTEKNISTTTIRNAFLELIGLIKTHKPMHETSKAEILLVNLIAEICKLEKYAGYKERALAILLSVLETNIVELLHPNIPFEEILRQYEEYNNEENPKMGEITSLNGFCDWIGMKEKGGIEIEFKEKIKTEYIGLKFQESSKELIELLKIVESQKEEITDKLGYWLKVESLLGKYRNYKTTYDHEILLSSNPEGIVFFTDFKEYLTDLRSAPAIHFLATKLLDNFLGGEQFQGTLCSECNKRFWTKFVTSSYKEFANRKMPLNPDTATEKEIKLGFVNHLLKRVEFMWPADWVPHRWNPKSEFKTEYAYRLLSQLMKLFPGNNYYIKLTMILASEASDTPVKERMQLAREYLRTTNDLSVWLTYVNICCTTFGNYEEGFKVMEKLIDLKEDEERLFILYRYLLHKLALHSKGDPSYTIENINHHIKSILNVAYRTLCKRPKQSFKETPAILPTELLTLEKILDSRIALLASTKREGVFIETPLGNTMLHRIGTTAVSLLFIFAQWVKYELRGVSSVTEYFNGTVGNVLRTVEREIGESNANTCIQAYTEAIYNDHMRLIHFENKVNPNFPPKVMKAQLETALKYTPYNMYLWLLYLKGSLKTSVISNKIFEVKSVFGASELSLFHYTLFLALELSYGKTLSELEGGYYQLDKITRLFKDGWINHSKQTEKKVTTSQKEGIQSVWHDMNNRGLYEDYYITRKYWHLYIVHVFQTYDKTSIKPLVKEPEFAKYALLSMDSCSYDKKIYLDYYKMCHELMQEGKLDESAAEIQRKEMEGVFALHSEKEIRFNSVLNPI